MRTPPIGAKRTPTIKKRGRTLLGVKIGLWRRQRANIGRQTSQGGHKAHCQAFNRCCRKAVSNTRGSHQQGDSRVGVREERGALAGLLDFGFLSSASRTGSCSSMDAVRVTSAWDMMGRCCCVKSQRWKGGKMAKQRRKTNDVRKRWRLSGGNGLFFFCCRPSSMDCDWTFWSTATHLYGSYNQNTYNIHCNR